MFRTLDLFVQLPGYTSDGSNKVHKIKHKSYFISHPHPKSCSDQFQQQRTKNHPERKKKQQRITKCSGRNRLLRIYCQTKRNEIRFWPENSGKLAVVRPYLSVIDQTLLRVVSSESYVPMYNTAHNQPLLVTLIQICIKIQMKNICQKVTSWIFGIFQILNSKLIPSWMRRLYES